MKKVRDERYDIWALKTDNGEYIGSFVDRHEKELDYILACVNACQGINPEALPGMVKAVQALIDFQDCKIDGDGIELNRKVRAALALARKGEGE